MDEQHTTRVTVIDDEDISRRGLAELLAEHPQLELVAVLRHHEALELTDWDGVDVAVVDAADERHSTDHFPGVAVVEHLRACRTSGLTIIVLTGHFFDDALRRRMHEARADFFYHRSDFASADQLYEAVLHPERARRKGVPDPEDAEALYRHGVNPSTRVNAGVAFAQQEALFAPPPGSGRRSRLWERRRESFNAVANLQPINADGTAPDRRQNHPSLPQIARFLEWATRVKRWK